jgi:hypothetical protein
MTTPQGRRGKIIVFGLVFWYPLAGVTWQFLHYLLGLRRIGWDVYYVEDSARTVYDPNAGQFTYDWASTGNVERLGPVLDSYGFEGRWAARCQYDNRMWGMSEAQLLQLYRDADAFLNVTGGQELLPEHDRIPRKVYVETDPVKTEIIVAQGDETMISILDAHDAHFTYGENFGAPDCGVPIERYRWLPTRQPVALDLWPWDDSPGAAYTTVATWNNKGNDIVWKGETYRWSKRPEFLKLLDLPRRRPAVTFEVASGLPPADEKRFSAHGWRLANAAAISARHDTYRDYLCRSRAEFTVAKEQNIRLRSGWFSDRSCCYLAAGRPVINQDTAFGNALPTGRGLFSFRTPDDIVAAVDAIEGDYAGNRRTAREIAAEYFDTERVLQSLCDRAGL